MAHLTLKTQTGVYTFSKKECLEQVANWEMYRDADNAGKWVWTILMMKDPKCKTHKACKAKEKEAQEILLNGSKEIIDVRWDRSYKIADYGKLLFGDAAQY